MYIILFFKGYLIIMNKYFTIMLATVMTSLAVTSSAHATFESMKTRPRPQPCSEPAAAMVALTALGLFVAARRRKSA
jgi:MYXO-CTERM domain-containing protein